jgi:hypothetical protein
MAMAASEPLTSVSIGLVSHPEDGLSAEELMTSADRAMYQAKKLGKNQISGNPRPRPALLARRSTFADVHEPAVPREAPVAKQAPEPEPAAEAPAAPEPSSPASPAASAAPKPSATPPASSPAPAASRRVTDHPARRAAAVSIATPEIRAVAVELGPVVTEESAAHRHTEEEDDADPQEVRRRIATASRSFDPDHQIRRAMDAFLSPVKGEGDRSTPEH